MINLSVNGDNKVYHHAMNLMAELDDYLFKKNCKKLSFLKRIINHVNRHNPQQKWVHFFGLHKAGIEYLLSRKPFFPVSVDSLKWDFGLFGSRTAGTESNTLQSRWDAFLNYRKDIQDWERLHAKQITMLKYLARCNKFIDYKIWEDKVEDIPFFFILNHEILIKMMGIEEYTRRFNESVEVLKKKVMVMELMLMDVVKDHLTYTLELYKKQKARDS